MSCKIQSSQPWKSLKRKAKTQVFQFQIGLRGSLGLRWWMGQEPQSLAVSLSKLPNLAWVHSRYTCILWCWPYLIFAEPVIIYNSAFSSWTWTKLLFKLGQAVSIASGHTPLCLLFLLYCKWTAMKNALFVTTSTFLENACPAGIWMNFE